jgi:hypothetical protein
VVSVVIDRPLVHKTVVVRTLKLLAALHRYIGTLLSLVFLAWFASGIVMMYAGYPLLGEAEKLSRMVPLASSSVRLTPAEAWQRSGRSGTPEHVRLAQLERRPVYVYTDDQHGWVTVAADDGSLVSPLTPAAAERVVALFAPGAGEPEYLGLEEQPDQWTMFALWAPYMSDYPFAPFHKFSLHDAHATQVSVLAATGDVVQETTRSERLWGYLGAVVHWIYPTMLRRHADAWVSVVVWLSAIGTALCLTGLVVGVSSYRWRRESKVAGSPFRGWLKWHHYLGLVFGMLASTWVFSGLISMDPWAWSLTDDTPDGSHQEIMRGGALNLAAYTRAAATAVAACNSALEVKELRLTQLRGEPYYWCVESPRRSLLVSGRAEQGGEPLARFDPEVLTAVARALKPNATIAESRLLDDYDAYYYPGWYDKLVNDATKRLPVLRVSFDDPNRTAIYIDPHSGAPVLAYDTAARWFRWLFHGLHSFDFGVLYRSRPLWDAIVLPLMLGGVLLSGTGVWIGIKWLARKLRKAAQPSRLRVSGALQSSSGVPKSTTCGS